MTNKEDSLELELHKYIRTRNGVFERDKCKTTLWVMHIIKSADTIEELCDELVIDTPICRHQMSANYIFDDMNYNPYEELEMLREQGIEYALYGAIWTDKGLIYVSKMKGILPNGEIDWELR